MPQDDENHLQEREKPRPGCRVECGERVGDGNVATSADVKLQGHDGKEVLTIFSPKLSNSRELYHPSMSGDKIGDIVSTIPELDISLVKLTSAASEAFTNTSYFQAEPPRSLLHSSEIKQGSWLEVDGMSSGLISLLTYGRRYVKKLGRLRSSGDENEFEKWQGYSISMMFGAVNDRICEGMRGAPIVQSETGGVVGIFQHEEGNGLYRFTADLDGLVEEGWQLAYSCCL
jgi:hypothetical protein